MGTDSGIFRPSYGRSCRLRFCRLMRLFKAEVTAMHRIARWVALAMLLVPVGASQAVEVSGDKVGEVLIFPIFTSENGWDTLITVHGASRRAALSLRVVLREGRGGAVVGSFNTYATKAAGEAVWRAVVFRDGAGQPRLRVAEGQCLIDSQGQPHSGAGVELPVGAATGLIEIYSVATPLHRELGTGTEYDCAQLAGYWGPQGSWTADPAEGLAGLTAAGISGEAVLVKVEAGLSAAFAATALRDFRAGADLVHTRPGSEHPSLADADPVARMPDGSQLNFASGIEAVAAVLSTPVLSNDVVVLDDVGARTDWILSYPTSGYHASRPFDVVVAGEARNCGSLGVYGPPSAVGDPVVTMPLGEAQSVFYGWSGDGPYGTYALLEELDPAPMTEVGVALCNAVNILPFSGKPSILVPEGSALLVSTTGLDTGGASHLWWWPPGMENAWGEAVLAFRLTTFVNGTLGGGSILANYALMGPHRRGAGRDDL